MAKLQKHWLSYHAENLRVDSKTNNDCLGLETILNVERIPIVQTVTVAKM
jgi:hypothetical protein